MLKYITIVGEGAHLHKNELVSNSYDELQHKIQKITSKQIMSLKFG